MLWVTIAMVQRSLTHEQFFDFRGADGVRAEHGSSRRRTSVDGKTASDTETLLLATESS